MFCCIRLPDEESEEIEPLDDDTFNRWEGNGLLSVYQSILSEHGKEKFRTNFFPHLKDLREPILDDQTSISKLFDYLRGGIDIYYENILDGSIDNFEPNSMDSVFALLVVGLHYGLNSKEYYKIRDLLFKTSYFDLEYLEIPIKNVMHLNKKFQAPEKNIWGNFYSEAKDPNCYRIPETCTIALFSDWATGSRSAINLSKEVAKLVPDYVVNLGDTYYSGTVSETKSRLVDPIKNYILKECPKTRVFMIPGNHDLYSGMHGVKYALKEFGQNNLFFSLYNSKVQFQGINTGFNDSNCFNTFLHTAYNTYLEDSEMEWHEHRINQRKDRKLIVLSHHMPISAWSPAGNIDDKTSPVNPKLFGQFKFCMNDIDLWLYGHDHSFSIFEPYTYDSVTLKAGRLIGNGACQYREQSMSHYEITTPGSFEVGEEVPRPVIKDVFPGLLDNLLNNSFVLMNIGLDSIRINYYEIPQIALGIFGNPKILYYEDILF
jgi:hypothetical protein